MIGFFFFIFFSPNISMFQTVASLITYEQVIYISNWKVSLNRTSKKDKDPSLPTNYRGIIFYSWEATRKGGPETIRSRT